MRKYAWSISILVFNFSILISILAMYSFLLSRSKNIYAIEKTCPWPAMVDMTAKQYSQVCTVLWTDLSFRVRLLIKSHYQVYFKYYSIKLNWCRSLIIYRMSFQHINNNIFFIFLYSFVHRFGLWICTFLHFVYLAFRLATFFYLFKIWWLICPVVSDN